MRKGAICYGGQAGQMITIQVGLFTIFRCAIKLLLHNVDHMASRAQAYKLDLLCNRTL